MAVNFDVMDLGRARLLDPEQMGYMDSLEIIKDESVKVQKSFVKIGWYLKHIRDHEMYLEDGYANIYDCAAGTLGYSQSTTSRFIKICEKFSKNGNSPELDEKYAGFDKSQMIEMLPLEQEQLEQVTPEMTVAQIREVKSKKKEIDEPDELPGQMDIEKDFPEYLPESDQEPVQGLGSGKYATSHKNDEVSVPEDMPEEPVIDGKYIEVPEELSADGSLDKEDSMTSQASDPTAETKRDKLQIVERNEAIQQPELPALKNDNQRKEWLRNYNEWGMWYRDENIDVNYYKFDFADGSRLVVAEYLQRRSYWSNTWHDECFYHLLEKNKKGYEGIYDETYRHKEECETYLVEFLKNLQKK